MRRAAFVLVYSHGGHVVAVSRRGGYALPGGGVETGESFAQGAARELEEETGLRVRSLVPLCHYERDGRRVAGFLGLGPYGTLRSSHEGVAAIVRPALVLMGPYGKFASECMKKARRSGAALAS